MIAGKAVSPHHNLRFHEQQRKILLLIHLRLPLMRILSMELTNSQQILMDLQMDEPVDISMNGNSEIVQRVQRKIRPIHTPM